MRVQIGVYVLRESERVCYAVLLYAGRERLAQSVLG